MQKSAQLAKINCARTTLTPECQGCLYAYVERLIPNLATSYLLWIQDRKLTYLTQFSDISTALMLWRPSISLHLDKKWTTACFFFYHHRWQCFLLQNMIRNLSAFHHVSFSLITNWDCLNPTSRMSRALLNEYWLSTQQWWCWNSSGGYSLHFVSSSNYECLRGFKFTGCNQFWGPFH